MLYIRQLIKCHLYTIGSELTLHNIEYRLFIFIKPAIGDMRNSL